jgi:hypothetical protein
MDKGPRPPGAIDGMYTLAELTAEFLPASTSLGTVITTDNDLVWNSGTAWVPWSDAPAEIIAQAYWAYPYPTDGAKALS